MNRLFSCSLSNKIYEHDINTMSVIATFSTTYGVFGIGGIGDRLYGIDRNNDKIYEYDPDTMTVISTHVFSTIKNGIGGTVSRLYAVSDTNFIEIDPDSANVLNSTIRPDTTTNGVGGINDRIFTAGSTGDEIFEHDLDTMSVIGIFSSPATEISGIGGTKDRLFSCDYTANKIYEHDINTMTVTSTYNSPDTTPFGIGGVKEVSVFDDVIYDLKSLGNGTKIATSWKNDQVGAKYELSYKRDGDLDWTVAVYEYEGKEHILNVPYPPIEYSIRVRATYDGQIGEWYETDVIYTDQTGFYLLVYHSENDIVAWDRNYLTPPSSFNSSINPAKAESSINSISVKLSENSEDEEIDKVSNWVYGKIQEDGKQFYRAKCELYYTDPDTLETSVKFVGLLKSVKSNNCSLDYDISIYSFIDELKKDVFSRELSEYTFTSTETLADIQTRLNTLYPVSAHTTPIAPDPVTDSTFLGWGIVEYDDSGETRKRIVFRGHPVDFLKSIFRVLYTEVELDPTNFDAYDNLYEDLVDVQSLDDIKSKYTGYEFEFFFNEPIDDVLEFVRENIYIPLGIYPVTSSIGKTKWIEHKQPTTAEVESGDITTLNENNILSGSFNKSFPDFENLVNHIKVKQNFDLASDKYLNQIYTAESNSVNKYKKLLPDEVFEMNYNISANNTIAYSELVNRYYSRFADNQQRLTIKTNIDEPNCLTGDYVFVNHKTQYDWKELKRGIVGGGADSIANLSVGDEWGSYLDVNDLDNYNGTVITTIDKEILVETFTDFQANYATVKQYLSDFLEITSFNLLDSNGDNLLDSNGDNLTVPI